MSGVKREIPATISSSAVDINAEPDAKRAKTSACKAFSKASDCMTLGSDALRLIVGVTRKTFFVDSAILFERVPFLAKQQLSKRAAIDVPHLDQAAFRMFLSWVYRLDSDPSLTEAEKKDYWSSLTTEHIVRLIQLGCLADTWALDDLAACVETALDKWTDYYGQEGTTNGEGLIQSYQAASGSRWKWWPIRLVTMISARTDVGADHCVFRVIEDTPGLARDFAWFCGSQMSFKPENFKSTFFLSADAFMDDSDDSDESDD